MNLAKQLPTLPQLDAGISPREIYRIGRDIAEGPIKLACSFSIEDVVLIDLLQRHRDELTVFSIDTGRLHEETFAIAESLALRYGITIEWYVPQQKAVEALVRARGPFSFRNGLEARRECCRIRKVEPLQRALRGTAAWLTGMRREQAVTRGDQQPLEIDHLNGGLLKINPLTYWTRDELWDYAAKQRLPVNALYGKGYTSIGCAPCTRAVQPGETERDGRWWWEQAEHRECGLHRR